MQTVAGFAADGVTMALHNTYWNVYERESKCINIHSTP